MKCPHTYIGTCVYIKYLHNITNILIPMTSALLDDLVAYMLAIKIVHIRF